MRDALNATLAHNLGLSAREVAEIGGFSDRFARDLMAGRRPFPHDVAEALLDIQDDIDVLTDAIEADVAEGQGVIWMYGDNAALRAARPDIPGRGARGGGIYRPIPHCGAGLRGTPSDNGAWMSIFCSAINKAGTAAAGSTLVRFGAHFLPYVQKPGTLPLASFGVFS